MCRRLISGPTFGDRRKSCSLNRISPPAAPRQFLMTWLPIRSFPWLDCECQPNRATDANVLAWDATRLELYVDDAQKNNGRSTAARVRERLTGKPVLNADVLDYLLRNPQLIPEDWKRKDKRRNARPSSFGAPSTAVQIAPTTFASCAGKNNMWAWDFFWLGSLWQDNFPAALWHVR